VLKEKHKCSFGKAFLFKKRFVEIRVILWLAKLTFALFNLHFALSAQKSIGF